MALQILFIIVVIIMCFQNYTFEWTVSCDVTSIHRQLSGLVVRMPACCAGGLGSNPGWGAQDFQYHLSLAETQQPVDCMQCKAREFLILSVLC